MHDSEERQNIICTKSMNVLKVSSKTFEIEELSKNYKPKFIRNKKREYCKAIEGSIMLAALIILIFHLTLSCLRIFVRFI